MKFLLFCCCYLSLTLCYASQDINTDHENHRQNHGKFIRLDLYHACILLGHVYKYINTCKYRVNIHVKLDKMWHVIQSGMILF